MLEASTRDRSEDFARDKAAPPQERAPDERRVEPEGPDQHPADNGPDRSKDPARDGAAPPQEPAPDEHRSQPEGPDQPPAQDQEPRREPRGARLKRHPLAAALGLLAVMVASAAGCVDSDYASQF